MTDSSSNTVGGDNQKMQNQEDEDVMEKNNQDAIGRAFYTPIPKSLAHYCSIATNPLRIRRKENEKGVVGGYSATEVDQSGRDVGVTYLFDSEGKYITEDVYGMSEAQRELVLSEVERLKKSYPIEKEIACTDL